MATQGQGGDFEIVAALLILIMPWMLAGVLGTGIGDFDASQSSDSLPVYIAVRPLTNGHFVLVKLAVALATTIVTWLVALLAAVFWLVLLGRGRIFSGLGASLAQAPEAFLCQCLLLLLFLVILTWTNLLGGIWASLAGRSWVKALSVLCRLALLCGLFALASLAKLDFRFKAGLLRWLPWLLAAGFMVKLLLSAVAFAIGLRRNALTRGAVGWIVGAWLVCGLFVAGYAGWICLATSRMDLWLTIAVGGFLVLPLANLALAPLALAWNRHR